MQTLDSLAALIHFLPRTGMEWRGLTWVPSTGCSGQCHCPRLLCAGLQGPLEVGLAAALHSSSLACSLPVGSTKTVQRPLQCSPCGIMAEQSWGHGPSSPVWDDGPRPGCSVGAPGQAPAISIPEPPGTPGPRRSRSGIDPWSPPYWACSSEVFWQQRKHPLGCDSGSSPRPLHRRRRYHCGHHHS